MESSLPFISYVESSKNSLKCLHELSKTTTGWYFQDLSFNSIFTHLFLYWISPVLSRLWNSYTKNLEFWILQNGFGIASKGHDSTNTISIDIITAMFCRFSNASFHFSSKKSASFIIVIHRRPCTVFFLWSCMPFNISM